jgi:hypothetical protein
MLMGALALYSLIFWVFIPITYQSVPVPLESQPNFKFGLLNVGESVVIANEKYDVSITLELPESETNFEVGNFDVEVRLHEDHMIRGMGIMKYRSPLIRSVRSFLFMIPILAGIWEESQIVQIGLHTEIQSAKDIETVEIKVYPKELQIYSMSLQLEVKLTGLRYFMHRYYYTSWILSVIVIFALESLTILYILYMYNLHKQKQHSIKLKKQIVENAKEKEMLISKANWILPKEKEIPKKLLIPVDFSTIIQLPIKRKPVYYRLLSRFGIRNNTIN